MRIGSLTWAFRERQEASGYTQKKMLTALTLSKKAGFRGDISYTGRRTMIGGLLANGFQLANVPLMLGYAYLGRVEQYLEVLLQKIVKHLSTFCDIW